jgi:hypothetical protein
MGKRKTLARIAGIGIKTQFVPKGLSRLVIATERLEIHSQRTGLIELLATFLAQITLKPQKGSGVCIFKTNETAP